MDEGPAEIIGSLAVPRRDGSESALCGWRTSAEPEVQACPPPIPTRSRGSWLGAGRCPGGRRVAAAALRRAAPAVAAAYMRRQRRGGLSSRRRWSTRHNLKLAGQSGLSFAGDRADFFALAAKVDAPAPRRSCPGAPRRQAGRDAGGDLDGGIASLPSRDVDFQAWTRPSRSSPPARGQARIVELRFFAGLERRGDGGRP